MRYGCCLIISEKRMINLVTRRINIHADDDFSIARREAKSRDLKFPFCLRSTTNKQNVQLPAFENYLLMIDVSEFRFNALRHLGRDNIQFGFCTGRILKDLINMLSNIFTCKGHQAREGANDFSSTHRKCLIKLFRLDQRRLNDLTTFKPGGSEASAIRGDNAIARCNHG